VAARKTKGSNFMGRSCICFAVWVPSTIALGLVVATPAPGGILQITFSNAYGNAVYDVSTAEGVWDKETQTLTWSLTNGPISIIDETSGEEVAVLVDASYCLALGPEGRVEMSLCFQAADTTYPTTVHAESPGLTFLPLQAPGARAIVSFELTDYNSDGFAQLVAVGPPGDGAFKALYNTGSVFSSLIYRVTVESAEPNAPAGTATVGDVDPDVGFRTIPASVQRISTDVELTLTPGDRLCVIASEVLSEGVTLPACAGDINGDGIVDMDDLTRLLAGFGSCSGMPEFDPAADLQEDGCIGLDDLTFMLQLFGTLCL